MFYLDGLLFQQACNLRSVVRFSCEVTCPANTTCTHNAKAFCNELQKNPTLSLSDIFPRTRKDEVTISDLRPITSGGTSSSLPQFGAGEVMPHPDLAGEGGKRSTRTPVKQTPNARPRARARTEEWSNLQSGRLHGDSGGRSAVTSGHPSETSSAFIRCTGRVPSVASDSGERAIVRRHLPLLQRRHRLSRLESMGNYGPLLAEHSVICACRRTGRGNLTATC